MTPRPPTFDPVESIRFVRFEYQMALEMARRVADVGGVSEDEEFVTTVAFIESFLVHARNLDAFLDSRGRSTDVKAKDYVPGFSKKVLGGDVLSSINRRLQHMTVYRQSDQTPWLPREIFPSIVEGMGEFIEQLAAANPGLGRRLTDVQAEADAFIGPR